MTNLNDELLFFGLKIRKNEESFGSTLHVIERKKTSSKKLS